MCITCTSPTVIEQYRICELTIHTHTQGPFLTWNKIMPIRDKTLIISRMQLFSFISNELWNSLRIATLHAYCAHFRKNTMDIIFWCLILYICTMNSLLYNNAVTLKPRVLSFLLNDPPAAAGHAQRTCGSGQQALWQTSQTSRKGSFQLSQSKYIISIGRILQSAD